MQNTDPVITGVGIISAAGRGVEAVAAALRTGRTGLGPLSLFHSARHAEAQVGQIREDVDRLADAVRGSRSDKLAWIAAREALQRAGLAEVPQRSAIDPARIGVVLGATVGGELASEEVLGKFLNEGRRRCGRLRYHECASAADLCARQLGAAGPRFTLSTACSAGALAIAAGAELIAAGEADVVLAGGCDSLCRLTLNGFGSLLLLDPSGCRPFDAHRAGISLGEGAGMLVLETAETARARGAVVVARLAGWGASCDAYHATAPHPEGDGAALAMQRALQRGRLRPDDIDYVNAHGTGTRDNDLVEAKALKRIFGERLPPFSSTMRFFGHALAASGAIKAVVCVSALQRQEIPPNPGFQDADPQIGLEPVRETRAGRLRRIMSNSFGFGGNNAVLIFSAPDAPPPEAPASPAPAPNDRGGSFQIGTSSCLNTEHRTPDARQGLDNARKSVTFQAGACLAVIGAGVVSPAGVGVESFFAACRAGAPAPSPRELPPSLAPCAVPAYACGPFGAEQAITPGRRRKLCRLQQMALVAARQSLPPELVSRVGAERACVAMGTGLGLLNEAVAIMESLVQSGEPTPQPLRFTNSVHNALASQVAMELGLRGMNSTATHREISFEAALWHARREVSAGGADAALVGGGDELNPYVLAAGVRWGWWDAGSPSCAPFQGALSGRRMPLTGEAAAVFALARPEMVEKPWACVGEVHMKRAVAPDGTFDAEAEARAIRDAIEQAGWQPRKAGAVLTGANGWSRTDERYRAVAQAFSRLVGRPVPCVGFKQWCGEFHSASALGFLAAIGLIRGDLTLGHLSRAEPLPAAFDPQPPTLVVLYTLSLSGVRAISCIGDRPF